MQTGQPNLFLRGDTIFGVCEAIGQDFGFNPNWLRLAFIAPLFFVPVACVAAYAGLGLVVAVSRYIAPVPPVAAAEPAAKTGANDSGQADLPIAA